MIIISCSEQEKKDQQSSNIDSLEMFHVKFNGKRVPLPEYYIPIKLESFLKKFKNDTIYKDSYWQIEKKYRKFEESPFSFQLFIDKHIKQNSILVFEGEYIALNKDLAGLYSGMLEKQLSQECMLNGFDFEILENRIFSNPRKTIIKIKLMISNEYGDSFETQYLVSENKKTYSINVSSLTSDDFEELIKPYW